MQTMIADWLDDAGAPLAGAPLGALLSAQAARLGDAPAFTCGGSSIGFAEMDRAANRIARALGTKGVCQDDIVVVSMTNRPAYAQVVFALWKLGAVPCPISHRLTPGEFSEAVALAAPRLIVGSMAASVAGVPLFDLDSNSHGGFDDSPLPPAVSAPGKILASGGSTGRPKLIIDPKTSVWGPDKTVRYRPPGSVVLVAGPLYHTAPFAFGIVALAEGSHIVCMERFDALEWLRLAESHRATVATMVPTMMSRIAKLDPSVSAGFDLSSFQVVMHSSAPCPADIKRWWLNRLSPEVVLEVYGGTERIGATIIDGVEWLKRPGSVGRPPPGDAVVIVDANGHSLPPGEVGEILFRRAGGPGTGYRYIGAESRIAADLDGMGDMGWLDEAGYLYIADRRTDMILVGGINVYPAEVEAAIERVPGVLCAAVIGLPDGDIGNRVHAIVELEATVPVPADGLRFVASALEILAPFKRPRSIEFTYERVRDDAGKVRRTALRASRIG